MAQDTLLRPLTKADFHAFMATEPEGGRYELEHGRIVTMPGGTGGHSDISSRFIIVIGRQLDEDIWALQGSDRGIETAETVRYPDVIIEQRPFDRQSRWAPSPALAIEVLSPDSEKRDLVTKAGEYMAIASLEAYIVAEPEEATCYVWVRDALGRFPTQPVEIKGAAGVIDVPALGLSIALAAVYRHLLKP
jgi:Uma2 family endonuclease